MQLKSWETLITAIFLVICLIGGLALGIYMAPTPAIGIVRFAEVISPDAANKLIQVIDAARQNDRIAGVVLEINSPGGLATSSENIFYSLLRLRSAKPLVVVIDGLAASGGYYMAVAANRIYATPSSYVGNVGTRGPRPLDPSIMPDELSSGPYKLSGGDRFDQIRQLDLIKDAFVQNVVSQRSHAALNPLTVDAATVAEARIYLGSEAMALGLIDGEGSRGDAIAAAAELAGVAKYDTVELLHYFDFDFQLDQTLSQASFQAGATALQAAAPPGAVYMLDSRIALADATASTTLERHLWQLRETAPNLLGRSSQPGISGDEGATPEPTASGG